MECPAALPHTQILSNPLEANSEETVGKPSYPSRVIVQIHSLVYESSPHPLSGRAIEGARIGRRRGGYRAMGGDSAVQAQEIPTRNRPDWPLK